MGPRCPPGPGWQQVPPPPVWPVCYVSIRQTVSQHQWSLGYKLPPLYCRSIVRVQGLKRGEFKSMINHNILLGLLNILPFSVYQTLKASKLFTGCLGSSIIVSGSGRAVTRSQAPQSQHGQHNTSWSLDNLSALCCGEATTSTTSAVSYLIISTYGVMESTLAWWDCGWCNHLVF